MPRECLRTMNYATEGCSHCSHPCPGRGGPPSSLMPRDGCPCPIIHAQGVGGGCSCAMMYAQGRVFMHDRSRSQRSDVHAQQLSTLVPQEEKNNQEYSFTIVLGYVAVEDASHRPQLCSTDTSHILFITNGTKYQ